MENQANSKSIILNYGLYLGVVSVLINLANYAFGDLYEPKWYIGVLSVLVLVVFIVLAIKKYRETNGGFLSWGQSLKVGVGVALISGVISILFQQILIHYIEPNYMATMMEMQTQKLVDRGLSQEQIKAAMDMGKKFQGPIISSAIGLVIASFLGFVISAIVGAIMKKSNETDY